MAGSMGGEQLLWRRPPHVLDPLMVEHVPATAPSVGDAALQHWINRVRWHADRAMLAGKAAQKAQDIAEDAAKKAIEMAGGVLPDRVNLAAHDARFRSGGDAAAKEMGQEDLQKEASQEAHAGLPDPHAEQLAANEADAATRPVQQLVHPLVFGWVVITNPWLEAIAIGSEAIATSVEAIATSGQDIYVCS
ncbi:unnamed protein product [Durusdinium trenchii]|uniref:Uncharacterized protein n=2 Tax=Durusdinium trenchii TaxID=1381693 RepID=A0ABP0LUB0_9DINO